MLKLFYKLSLFCLILLSATVLYQKNTYAYHTLAKVDPLPHTKELIAQEHYVDAQEYLEYFMQFEYVSSVPESQTLLRSIKTKRESLEYRSAKVYEGISTGTSDELEGQISAIGSDFFLIGDLRDLAIEGSHYLNDEEVDTLLVSLCGIGLVASASTLFTLGSSAVAKSAVSVLKLAHKSKQMPAWLGSYLLKQTKLVKESKNTAALKPLFKTIEEMHTYVGLKDTLKLLSHTRSMKELKNMATLSKRYGKETSILLDLSKNKILTHTKTLEIMNKKSIKIASVYGSRGFIYLLKGGEKNFIKTTKRMKAYAKVGYKGEIWKVLLWLMKHLSDTMLIIILSVASLLLIPLRRIKRFL